MIFMLHSIPINHGPDIRALLGRALLGAPTTLCILAPPEQARVGLPSGSTTAPIVLSSAPAQAKGRDARLAEAAAVVVHAVLAPPLLPPGRARA